MGAMKQQYGSKHGEEVFYASKNKGTISGVDAIADSVVIADGSIPGGPLNVAPGVEQT